MRSRASQADTLLAYLRKHPEGIDRKTAEAELGICSLSRRICDLRDRGIRIAKRRKKLRTRYTKGTEIVVYSLERERGEREAPATPAQERPPDKDARPIPAPSETAKSLIPEIDGKGQRRLFR